MPNIIDILARALSLRQETALNSITPNRAGGIMYDTLLVLNQMQLEGGSLLISKVYASVSAMEADTTPTSDLTGRALKPGQLVVIVTSDSSSSDMGSEYRFNGPGSWTYVGKVGGLPLDTVPTQSSTKGITSGGVYTALAAMKAEGYKYMGLATPGSGGTAPGTPNQPVFYIGGPGFYPNFGSITVASGYLGFIKYSGGSWSVESVAVGKDYDAQISALDGQITQLEAEVSQLDFTVNGGNKIAELTLYTGLRIDLNTKVWRNDSAASYYIVPISANDSIRISKGAKNAQICFLSAYTTPVNGATPSYATGWTEVDTFTGEYKDYTAPSDAVYLYVLYSRTDASTITMPSDIIINGVSYMNAPSLQSQISALQNGKQENLVPGTNLDNTPIEGSNNPVTSDGVFQAVKVIDTKVTKMESERNLYPVTKGTSASGTVAVSGDAGYIHITLFILEEVDGSREIIHTESPSNLFITLSADKKLYCRIGSTYENTDIEFKKGELYDVILSWDGAESKFSLTVNGEKVAEDKAYSGTPSGNLSIKAAGGNSSLIKAQILACDVSGTQITFNNSFDYESLYFLPIINEKVKSINEGDISLFGRITTLESLVGINPKLGLAETAGFLYHQNPEANPSFVIPSQSLYDIAYAKALGCKAIEGNLQKCQDGVFVVKHGVSGTLGRGLKFADGSGMDADTLFADVSSTDLRLYVTYDSPVAKYNSPIPTLDEFCATCASLDMVAYLRGIDAGGLAIARKYLPDERIIADGLTERGDFKGIMLVYRPAIATDLDEVITLCKKFGAPFIYSGGNFSGVSDVQFFQLTKLLHDNGFLLGSGYLTAKEYIKFKGMGLDIHGSIGDKVIPAFYEGNTLNLIGNTDTGFILSGATYDAVSKKIMMVTDDYITVQSAEVAGNLSKECLRITFDGEIDIDFGNTGEALIENLVSDGCSEIVIAEAVRKLPNNQVLKITAKANTEIIDINLYGSVLIKI